jgi:hypothetical protein
MHLQLGLKQCIGTTEGWALARPLKGCAKAQPAVLLIQLQAKLPAQFVLGGVSPCCTVPSPHYTLKKLSVPYTSQSFAATTVRQFRDGVG